MSDWMIVVVVAVAVALAVWMFFRRRQLGIEGRSVKLDEAALVAHVRLAINPSFTRWVLFSNGTYVIVEDEAASHDAPTYALEQMKQFGPVHVGSPAGDFSVTTLDKTQGWSVSGHGCGMYTYVHPSELKGHAPSDIEVGLYGRSKRAADAKELRIIHVNGSH